MFYSESFWNYEFAFLEHVHLAALVIGLLVVDCNLYQYC